MPMMAQEASEASVASTSSSGPNWWDVQLNTAAASTSWSHHLHPWQPHNPNSNSSCEEDISISTTTFTNASNQSGLSADSAPTDLAGDHAENHLWSQVFLGVGSVGDMRNTHNEGENFLEVLSSKSHTTEMSEPACNYLKKLDGSWGTFANPTPSFNNLDKQMNTYNGCFMEHEKLNNLSDLVNNWSIAPPASQACSRHMNSPNTCSSSLSNPMARYMEPGFSHIKHEAHMSPTYSGDGTAASDGSSGALYKHQMKRERQHQEFSSHNSGYHIGLSSPLAGINKYYGTGVPDAQWSSTRSYSDLVSFGGCLSKPLIDFRGSKSCVRSLDSAENRKQGLEAAPSKRGSGSHPSVTSDGKKKRSEDNTETHTKKSKHESSTAPSVKLQVPKVKLGERITALQQIVSPFGKTDTASVLMETINYIKFLHEQVQLLSDPYMKPGVNKVSQ
uniref:Transcription factor bHLH111 n=1 Tax=Anthurium amnicola TaxID=1678845 RepID=A0A1D1YNB0_9ARAE